MHVNKVGGDKSSQDLFILNIKSYTSKIEMPPKGKAPIKGHKTVAKAPVKATGKKPVAGTHLIILSSRHYVQFCFA